MSRTPGLGSQNTKQSTAPHISGHVRIKRDLEALRRWRTREDAARRLARHGRSAVPGLVQALYEQNVGVRLHAIQALSGIQDARGIEGLIGALWDESPLVRQAAANALGMLGHDRAIDGLLRILDDNDVWVRREGAFALGIIGAQNPASAARIVHALLGLAGDAMQVRHAALDGLVRIGSHAIPPLRDGLYHADWIVRKTAANALARIGDASIPTLEYACHNGDASVKRMATWALERVGIV